MNNVESGGNNNILIIDDNPADLCLLNESLFSEGYRPIQASDGTQGQRMAATARPDLILLDVKMPNESGFDVLMKMKQNPDTASIPVIFLTGSNDLESKVRGFEMGAVGYIVKPFNISEIKARIHGHLKIMKESTALLTKQASQLKTLGQEQQFMMVPPDKYPEAKFGVYFESLHEAGGDMYDVIKISDDIYGYFIGDVSGHEIKTSFTTASMIPMLRQNCSISNTPIKTIKIINDLLCEILPPERFVTSCYARLDRSSMVLSLVNSGHTPTIYHPVGEEPRYLGYGGSLLGMFESPNYEQVNFAASPGDRIYLYTDGLFDRPDADPLALPSKQFFLDLTGEMADYSIGEAPEKIIEKMFESSMEREDDVTILAFEV